MRVPSKSKRMTWAIGEKGDYRFINVSFYNYFRVIIIEDEESERYQNVLVSSHPEAVGLYSLILVSPRKS